MELTRHGGERQVLHFGTGVNKVNKNPTEQLTPGSAKNNSNEKTAERKTVSILFSLGSARRKELTDKFPYKVID